MAILMIINGFRAIDVARRLTLRQVIMLLREIGDIALGILK
jgi:hypothetical protein